MTEGFLLLIFVALVMETIDSSLGMMYGTILSPVLIGYGYEPLAVIPAILLSQAIGGISGTAFHQKFRNADFKGMSRDMKVVLAMIVPGLFVVVFGVFVAVSLPVIIVKIYVAILVIVMSSLCLSPLRYKFAWWKHYIIGVIAAFNKTISGGAFGPVTSTGGIIGGLKAKVSIATTTLAEVCICFAGFAVYAIMSTPSWKLIIPLSIGAFIGGIIGPYFCSKGNHILLRKAIGILGIVSGLWLFYRILT